VARLTQERKQGLVARARVLAEIRAYFAEEGFLEVEPPTLVRSPGLEVSIEAVQAGGGYLITSPEYSMKRLLAGGLERIYAMPRCFRANEQGAQHDIEFTMLEWYRAWDGLDSIMKDVEALVRRCAQKVQHSTTVQVGPRPVDVGTSWQRISIADAFQRWAGFALDGTESADEFCQKMRGAEIDPGTARDWDELFSICFVERIDPALAKMQQGVFLYDWPTEVAALARKKPDDPRWALRFEAYVGGVELANAFDELTDPAEQRQRFEKEQAMRSERGLAVYPIDERFMAALEEGLPPSAGIALGVDRLAMLAAGADSLQRVSAFSGDER
jgi:lysyl-tRNA synthetase class 2